MKDFGGSIMGEQSSIFDEYTKGQSSNVLKPMILTPYILYFVSMTSNKLQCS